jgi:transposase
VGRTSGQCRLRVHRHTDGKTLQQHVHGYTTKDTIGYTDDWQGYNQIKRVHHTVGHGQKEWARDDDGDGIREIHTNTIEGLWATARNFLRPFRGGHKKYLPSYLAMCEHKLNRNRISPAFIARLVTQQDQLHEPPSYQRSFDLRPSSLVLPPFRENGSHYRTI